MDLHSIINNFGFIDENVSIENLGTGLINQTWKVKYQENLFILQKINHQVFKEPEAIGQNIQLLGSYLIENVPDYLFTHPLKTIVQKSGMYKATDGYYRMFPYVKDSHSVTVVHTEDQAYEAAYQFGKFTQVFKNFDAYKLATTIPNFHNISLRFDQFIHTLKHGNKERLQQAKKIVNTLLKHEEIVKTYLSIQQKNLITIRVTHHDTKISNVLFNQEEKGLCVIDLDTVMPGYYISDVGDMFRTYLSPVSEEEDDFSKIEIRETYFQAILQGYIGAMNDILTKAEKTYFFYAGKFMIYMQALRFLTDYLNNDIYYGAKYPEHNYVRAMNQTILLERFIEKAHLMNSIFK